MNGNDVAQFALEQANLMNERFAAGLRAGKQINRIAAAALKAAYENAQKDEAVKIPTPLHCAIENVLRLHAEQEVNDYANAMVKRDQEVPQWERELRQGAEDRGVGR